MKNAHKLNFDFDELKTKKPSKLKNLLSKAEDFGWKVIGWRIRHFGRAVANMIRWAPVIWKDQDWDHRYIYDILRFKLENQAKYIGSRDIHTRAKRDAEIMMICVRLIEKVSDEFYDCEWMDYHESEYNFVPCIENIDYSKLEIEEKSNRFHEYFAKYPRQYKLAQDPDIYWPYNEKTDRTIAMWIAHRNQERAQDILFKLINRNIRGWWD